MELNEKEILKILNRSFLSSPKYLMNNLFVYDWESDYLAITKSLYAYEIEVKISINDYRNDFKKKAKHRVLYDMFNNTRRSKEKDCPNYFYYACPENMIEPDNTPPYAGLIYIIKDRFFRVVKAAPKLHSVKFDSEYHKLTDKFYYNMVTWKKRHEHDSKVIPQEQVKAAVRTAVMDVRMAAVDAYRRSCLHAVFPYGTDYPMCSKKDLKNGNKLLDCDMKCFEGRKFKELFYK